MPGQIGFTVYAAPDEKVRQLVLRAQAAEWQNKLRIAVRRLEDGSQRKITDALLQFVAADDQRG